MKVMNRKRRDQPWFATFALTPPLPSLISLPPPPLHKLLKNIQSSRKEVTHAFALLKLPCCSAVQYKSNSVVQVTLGPGQLFAAFLVQCCATGLS